MGTRIADWFVKVMATWAFIFGILLVCVLEIWANAKGVVHFDPTMIVLNTILSLWAAIQGSIIMINQNVADRKRDAMLSKILKIETRMEKLMKEEKKDGKVKVQHETVGSNGRKDG